MERLGLVALAWQRTVQLPAALDEAWLAIRQRIMLVALRLAVGAKMVATLGLLVLPMVQLLVAIPVGSLCL